MIKSPILAMDCPQRSRGGAAAPPVGSCAGNDPPALVAAAAAQRRPEPRSNDAGGWDIQTTKKKTGEGLVCKKLLKT